MGKLIDLIPAYREINGIYSKLVADGCPLRFEWQKPLSNFWKEYSEVSPNTLMQISTPTPKPDAYTGKYVCIKNIQKGTY